MLKQIKYLAIILAFTSCSIQNLNTEKQEVNNLLDDWHHAATVANEKQFFNKFSQNGIYIGTDPTENWSAEELQLWAKKTFERDTAWAFQPYDRHIYFSKNARTAWFDELLKTWMGPCRGSGVLIKENNQWKLAHYHLSVAVPNDKMEAYLKILKDEN